MHWLDNYKQAEKFSKFYGYWTGLADFHKMCITVMKMYYSKQKSIIHYCKSKDFNNDSLIKDIQILLTKSFNEDAILFHVLK